MYMTRFRLLSVRDYSDPAHPVRLAAWKWGLWLSGMALLGILAWSGYTYLTLRQSARMEHAEKVILAGYDDFCTARLDDGYGMAWKYLQDPVAGRILRSQWYLKGDRK